jgi:hypothetical protein
MLWIEIDLADRRRVFEEYRVWSRDLPREAGQVGSNISICVEGPTIGRTVQLQVDRRFLPRMAASGIPFKER